MGWAWLVVVFIGAFVLAGSMAWAKWRNAQSDVPVAKSERGARELRDELNERDGRA